MFLRKNKRKISLLLVITLILTITNWDLLFEKKIDYVEPNIVEEIIERRTLNEKYFLNDDGSITVKQYNTPVHYVKDGKLEDIDSSLEKIVKGNKTLYKTKGNDIAITLPEEIDKNNKIEVSHNSKQKLFMSPGETYKEVCSIDDSLGIKDTFKVIETKATMNEGNDIRTVVYEYNKNTNVSYTTTDFGIKEEFILKEYDGNNIFVSNINLEGLKLRLTSDNKIEVLDKNTDEIVGIMPQPYVYDSSEEFKSTLEAYYKIEEVSKDKYRIKVEVDKEFLEREDITYPVYIDPTYSKKTTGQISTYVMNKGNYAGWNFCSPYSLSMPAGYRSDQGKTRSYVLLAYPNVGKDLLIKSEYVMYAKGDGSHKNSGAINLYQVTKNWDPTKITYNSQPTIGKKIDDVYFNAGDYGWKTFDITQLQTEDITGKTPSYGLMLRANNENASTYRNFANEDYTGYKPYVKYIYGNMPNAPTVKVYGNGANTASGYVDISWPKLSGAAGYEIGIWNGIKYEFIDVGNVGSFSTKGKGIWPTATEIAKGRRSLHTKDKNGTDLANDPSLLYNTQKGTPDKDKKTYWIRVRAYNKYGDRCGDSPSAKITLPDRTAPGLVPNLQGTVTIPEINGGDKGIVDLKFSKPKDYPVDNGIQNFTLEIRSRVINQPVDNKLTTEDIINKSTEPWTAYKGIGGKIPGTSTTYKVSNLEDSKAYQFRIKAVDKSGNYSGWTYSSQYIITDRTGPKGPSTLKYLTEYNKGNTFNIEYDGITDDSTILSVKFKIPGEDFKDYGKITGSVDLNTESINSGIHNIEMKMADSFGNYTIKDIPYKKDNTAPEYEFSAVGIKDGQAFNGVMNLKTKIADTHSGIKTWEINYLNLSDSTLKDTGIIKSGTQDYDGNISFDTGNLKEDNTYKITFKAEDKVGNKVEKTFNFVRSNVVEDVKSETNITINEKISEGIEDIKYDNKLKANLYIYNVKEDKVTNHCQAFNLGDKLSINALTLIDGESYYGYITAINDGKLIYSKNAYKKELFRSSTGELEKTFVDTKNIEINNNEIKNISSKEEAIIQTKEFLLNYHVDGLEIDLDENITDVYIKDKETGKEILLKNEEGFYRLTNPQKNIQLIFKLKPGGKINLLKVTAYGAMRKDAPGGSLFTIKLVEEPTNVVATPNIDYMTKISWEKSKTNGVKYNVYRSESKNFKISKDNLLAEEIEETTFKDYNLNYGKTFYYKVVAVRNFNGEKRYSKVSNEVFAKIVDEKEVSKKVGIQANYEFVSFRTSDGNGNINVENQNLVYQSKDIIISSPSLAMVLNRTYNSLSTTKSIFGYNTDLSFNTSILKEYDNTNKEVAVLLKDGDGTIHRFTKNSSGGYDTPAGIFMKLTYDSTKEIYRIDRNDRISYIFDKQMRLEKFIESNGNYLEIIYDVNGNIDKVQNNINDYIKFNYNAKGLVDKTISSLGQEVIYKYSDEERLVEITTYINNIKEDGNKVLAKYEYNQNGDLTSITDPNGQKTIIEYTNGKVNKVIYPNKETSEIIVSGNSTTVKNERGKSRTYKLNDKGLVSEESNEIGQTFYNEYNDNYQVTKTWYFRDNRKILTETEYDMDGNVIKIKDAMGNIATFSDYHSLGKPRKTEMPFDEKKIIKGSQEFDSKGNIIKEIDALNRATEYSYDNLGQLIENKDIYGNVIKYTYDVKGRLIKQIDSENRVTEVLEYDKYNNPTQIKDIRGNITTNEYNSLGNLVKTSYSNGFNENYYYDKNSNLVLIADSRGREVKYEYDSMDRLVKKILANGSVYTYKYEYDTETKNEIVVEIDPDGVVEKKYYDELGRVLKVTVGDKIEAEYKYDYCGNLVEVKDATGKTAVAEYDDLGRQTKATIDPNGMKVGEETVYNAAGAVISQKVSNGSKKDFEYDSLGRVSKISEFDGKENLITEYRYEEKVGDLIKNTTINPAGIKSETYFDKAGRTVKAISYGNKEGTIKEEKKYEYNSDDSTKKIINADGSYQTFQYDKYGEVTKTEYFTKDGKVDTKSVYIHDEYGRLVGTEEHSQGKVIKSSYSYDILDRLYQKVEGNQAVKYEYTQGDRLKEIAYPDQTEKDNEKNIGYEYDKEGRIKNVKLDDKLVSTINYRIDNQVENIKYYTKFDTGGTDYLQMDYKYNGLGLTTSVEYKKNGKDLKEKTEYSYDNFGYISKEVASNYYETKVETVTKEYEYDKIGRLISSTNNKNKTKYEYDKVGNKVKETNIDEKNKTVVNTYKYDGYNRILQSFKDTKLSCEYSYDGRGNTIASKEKIIGSDGKDIEHQKTYKYNIKNQLVESTTKIDKETYVTKNLYDVDGKRVRKDEDGEVQNYIYLGDEVLYTTDANGNKAIENILDPTGKIIATKRFDGEFKNKYFTFTYDGRGSVVSILDPEMKRVKGYGYDEFGNTKEVGNKNFKNDVKFTGMTHDEKSGLYYMNARHYNPTSGRFLTQDSVEGSATEPWTQNLYSYAGNNPVNYVDPTGHWFETAFDIFSAASSVYEAVKNPSIWTIGAAVFDVAAAIIPFVPAGAGRIVKAVKRVAKVVDKALDATKYGRKIKQVASAGANFVSKGYRSTKNFISKGAGKVSSTYNKLQSQIIKQKNRLAEAAVRTQKKLDSVKCSIKSYYKKTPQCFVAGTKIKTASGDKNIEDIKIGDKVLSANVETGEVSYKRVVNLFESKTDTIVKLKIGRENIETTVEHPFYVLRKGWVDAQDLQATDKVILASGEIEIVKTIEIEEQDEVVYNFEVEDWHTYYVGESGVLVHNACGAAKGTNKVSYWDKRVEFNGNAVYQRNDLFDSNSISTWKEKGNNITGTNIQRMQSGRAPIGYDGKSVNLHHMTQTQSGAIAEVGQSFHQMNKGVIHINPNTIPSGINRNTFNQWKQGYWKNRANDFIN